MKPHFRLRLERWQRPLTATRSTDAGRHYVVRNDEGAYIAGLSFRHTCALAAAEAGHVHAVRRRRTYYGMWDDWMEHGCDLFGVANGTLWVLARDGLIEDCRGAERGAVLGITPKGDAVLSAIREAGCETLLTERLAA